jgi:hypothetical protein
MGDGADAVAQGGGALEFHRFGAASFHLRGQRLLQGPRPSRKRIASPRRPARR